MPRHKLIINQRFVIDEDLHTLKDVQTGITTRLELRLVLLIVLLAKQKKEVVSRTQLINDIWGNYGGAEEGLNQAISALRKLMGDTDKKIIETIPKKGYLLNAIVNEGFKPRKSILQYVVLIMMLMFLALIILMMPNKSQDKPLLEPSGGEADTTYQNKELDSIRKSNSTGSEKAL